MIWLKRILPLALIVAAWFAYTNYTENQIAKNERFARQYALVTAQVWLATAEYRNDNAEFLRVRDSLLVAAGCTKDDLEEYLQENKSRPEFYAPYVRLVKTFVDSLSQPPVDSAVD